jgi:VanZ family protein|tara:strand:+ start:8590 stop:8910 length:321 start_codon:yes stop_codon:yes gene_type:complete
MLFMILLSHVPQDNIPSNTNFKINNIDYIFHLIEYTIFGFLLYNTFKEDSLLSISPIWSSLLFGILFAISDELHQNFVAGRNMSFADLCFDIIGINIGLLCSLKKS